MRVCIVCQDLQWIFGKFAYKMKDALEHMGIESVISEKPINDYDVNHFISYALYKSFNTETVNSLMITHVDNLEKIEYIRKEMHTAKVGVCMSHQTYEYLINMGVDSSKLTYINPAHDGLISVKKIVIGFACRVQDDGRKREYFINKLAEVLNPMIFKFRIMGDGWDKQVEILKKKGFEVDYFDNFDYKQYISFIPSLDYYLYMGMDEGQMGFVDALASGIKTIVTEQGYHLDAENGITHGFTTYEELENILLGIEKEKIKLIESVKTWNWLDYTKKHVEIWEYILSDKVSNSNYKDGLNVFLKTTDGDKNFDVSIEEKRLNEQSKIHIRNVRKKHLKLLFNKDTCMESARILLSTLKRKIF